MKILQSLNVFDIYEKNSERHGNLPALNFNSIDSTHEELFKKTAQLATGLKGLNLKPGSRVAIVCQNHPVFFHLFGACAGLNLVLVLINRRLSHEEIKYIIEDTTPELIITDSGKQELAEQLVNECSCLDNYFIVGSNDDTHSISNLYSSKGLDSRVECEMDDPYIIIHTAAVQGKPRGAVLSHGNVILSNQQIISEFKLDKSQTYLNILPLFHIMGVNLGLGTLQAGGKNVILEKFDSNKTLELIQDQQVNLIGSFPPILNNLMEAIQAGSYDLESLRIAAGIEQPDTVTKWEDLTNSKFWTMYGQTETSGLITFSEYFSKPGSAGEVSTLANIKIIDDLDNFLPPGQVGEIVVRGPLVFQGYWQADELNQHTFREDWHHTGDLGMLDSEGFLFFKGRKAEKELIKPGGENVFPAEVEKVILEHPAVKEVCVFGVPDPKFGEGIKAVCSLNADHALTKQELIDFTGTKIAGYKKPRYIDFVKELPKTEDGSIDREKIKIDN
jgi:acyl-CoA synthetase (AMP-forming)/AMP-acid ligase II